MEPSYSRTRDHERGKLINNTLKYLPSRPHGRRRARLQGHLGPLGARRLGPLVDGQVRRRRRARGLRLDSRRLEARIT